MAQQGDGYLKEINETLVTDGQNYVTLKETSPKGSKSLTLPASFILRLITKNAKTENSS
jgi:hypothetical protein